MQSYSEHLDQLLDGELDPMLEPALYAELATNADLRSELRDHLAMKTAVKDDRMALVPPALLTSSVFSTLGFAAPFAGAAAGTVGGSVLWQWLTRLGLPILSALTAAGISWSVSQNAFTDFVATSGARVTEPAVEREVPPAATEAPVVAASTASDELAALQQENRQLRAQLAAKEQQYQPPVSNVELPAVTETVIDEPQEVISVPQAANATMTIANVVDLQRDPTPQTIRLASADIAQRPQERLPFMAQIRGMSLSPTVTTSVSEQAEWYSNLGVAILYRMNASSAVGFEVGNEAYPMVFDGNRNGQIVRYEQYPSTMWAGITYRYTGSALRSLPLAPFGQILLGGSRFGPMGRLQAGLQYAPAGPLVFLFGIEGSAMTFSYQNQWYLSPKLGLTYGMAFRF